MFITQYETFSLHINCKGSQVTLNYEMGDTNINFSHERSCRR